MNRLLGALAVATLLLCACRREEAPTAPVAAAPTDAGLTRSMPSPTAATVPDAKEADAGEVDAGATEANAGEVDDSDTDAGALAEGAAPYGADLLPASAGELGPAGLTGWLDGGTPMHAAVAALLSGDLKAAERYAREAARVDPTRRAEAHHFIEALVVTHRKPDGGSAFTSLEPPDAGDPVQSPFLFTPLSAQSEARRPTMGSRRYVAVISATFTDTFDIEKAKTLWSMPANTPVTVLQVRGDRARVSVDEDRRTLEMWRLADGGFEQEEEEETPVADVTDAGSDAGADGNDAGTDGGSDAGAEGSDAGTDGGSPTPQLTGWVDWSEFSAHPVEPGPLLEQAAEYEKAGDYAAALDPLSLARMLAPSDVLLPRLARAAAASGRWIDVVQYSKALHGRIRQPSYWVSLTLVTGCRGNRLAVGSISSDDKSLKWLATLDRNACIGDLDYPKCDECGYGSKYNRGREEKQARAVAGYRTPRLNRFPDGPWVHISFSKFLRPRTFWVYGLRYQIDRNCNNGDFFQPTGEAYLSPTPVRPGTEVEDDVVYWVRAPVSHDDILYGLVEAPNLEAARQKLAGALTHRIVQNVAELALGEYVDANDEGCESCECGD